MRFILFNEFNPNVRMFIEGSTNTMAKIKFADVTENITTRQEFPLEKAQNILKDEVVAVLGYGVQGPAQALNMRDNGVNVIIACRRPAGSQAQKDSYDPSK